MDTLISEFTWWLLTLIAVYAVIFVALRFFLRRYVFPFPNQRNDSGSSSGTAA